MIDVAMQRSVLLVLGGICLAVGQAYANLIVNGGFETTEVLEDSSTELNKTGNRMPDKAEINTSQNGITCFPSEEFGLSGGLG